MKQKKYQIKFLEVFYVEFNEIYNYIFYKLKNEIAARNFIVKVYEVIEKQSYYPKIFQSYRKNELCIWYRMFVGNFTIFYIVEESKIIISHIIYGARNLDKLI